MFLFDKCNNLCYLSNKEYVKIIASLKYHYEKEFKCNYPDKFNKYKDPNRVKLFHQSKSMCGKVANSIPSTKHRCKNLLFLTCPCSFEDPGIFRLIELENLYNKFGILPKLDYKCTSEGLLNTPSKLLQAFKLIRSFLTEKELEELKRQEIEHKQRLG